MCDVCGVKREGVMCVGVCVKVGWWRSVRGK